MVVRRTVARRTFLGGLAAPLGLGLSVPVVDEASAQSAQLQAAAPADMLSDYDARRFGAVWDGESHPLSERFSSLEDARAVYPHAQALSDETDWAAVQSAIDAIVLVWAERGARYGGIVQLPPGTGRFNRALFYPANSVWLHESFPVVGICGQGRQSTILEWRDNTAIIEGGYVLQPRNAAVVDGKVVWSGDHAQLHADCRLTGFALRGPGNWHGFPPPESEADFIVKYGFQPVDWTQAFNQNDARLGQLYETYSGLSAGENTSIEDIYLQGFHVGLNWRGGQKRAELVYTQNCYYGVYLTYTEGAHGDFVLRKCNFSGRFAAVALAPNGGWFGHLDTCYIGNSPYGFYKEGTPEDMSSEQAAAAYGGHWNDFLTGILTYCQFESIGNSMICEGNVSRRHQLRDLTLQNCAHINWHDKSFPASPKGYKGAILRDALIDVARWTRVSITRSHDPTWWTPRNVAVFLCGEATEVIIDSCDGFIAAAATAGKAFFHNWAGFQPTGAVRLRGDRWDGIVFQTNPQMPAIAVGDLVGLYGLFCGPYTDNALAFAGIAMESTAGTQAPAFISVATRADGIPVKFASAPQQASRWTASPTVAGKAIVAEGGAHLGVALAPIDGVTWWCNVRQS